MNSATLAVILGRVSTEDQAEEGTGLAAQIEAGMGYISLRGYTLDTSVGYASEGLEYVPGVFQEDYTGKVIYRPAVNHLLDTLVQRPIRVIVVHRTSRLGRRGSVQEALEAAFKEHGARVEYVTAQFDTSTPTGRAMRRISGVFDELDYEQIIDQLREGKFQRAKAGSIVVSRPPFGYRLVKEKDASGKKTIRRLEINEEEARIVILIYTWYLEEDLSMFIIAQRLTDLRVPTRGDDIGQRRRHAPGTWGNRTVYTVLTSKVYTGLWHYGKTRRVPIIGSEKTKSVQTPEDEWIPIRVPAIIDEDTFQAAQRKAAQNAVSARRNRKHFYLLVGHLRCQKCNYAFVGSWSNGTTPVYRCNGRHILRNWCCDMPIIREDELEPIIWDWLKEVVKNPEQIDEVIRNRQADADRQNERIKGLLATNQRLLVEKKAKQINLIELYGRTPLPAIEESIVALEREIAGHEQQQEELTARLVKTHFTPEYITNVKATCARIATGIDYFTSTERAETYDLLEVSAELTVEEGYKIAYAECVLVDEPKRLIMKPVNGIAFPSSR
jgi:site-specific DNA recombinase